MGQKEEINEDTNSGAWKMELVFQNPDTMNVKEGRTFISQFTMFVLTLKLFIYIDRQ